MAEKKYNNKNMENVTMKLSGDILTITVDLSKEVGPSKTGKTIIVGTTSGNKKVKDNPDIFVGVNAFKKKSD